ncbi:MAG: hypothetical protein QOK40_3084 [Miltoncostaeaceae bacterium]|nr:hypothetical protein [Miltoncostaeaceae bacterium]
MKCHELTSRVAERAGISQDDADAAIRAVLATLAERMGSGEADDLAAQLPKEFKSAVPAGVQAERLDLDGFARRVATRSRIPDADGLAVTQAVFGVLREGEIEDVPSALPRDFERALPV